MKILFLLLIAQLSFAQKFEKDSVLQFQKELNEHYADTASSPLKKEDLKHFVNLEFYPISETYFVQAKFTRTKKEKPFEMKTTTARKPIYVKYGELQFTINDVPCKLNVYQNVEYAKKPGHQDSLFLPFTDLSRFIISLKHDLTYT